MAINKKLIHFKKKEYFDREVANGNVPEHSICFIQDTKEIYTHGQLYSCNVDLSSLEDVVRVDDDSEINRTKLGLSGEYLSESEKTISYSYGNQDNPLMFSHVWNTPSEYNLAGLMMDEGIELASIKTFDGQDMDNTTNADYAGLSVYNGVCDLSSCEISTEGMRPGILSCMDGMIVSTAYDMDKQGTPRMGSGIRNRFDAVEIESVRYDETSVGSILSVTPEGAYYNGNSLLTVDEEGTVNKTALSIGGFSVVDKPYTYSIRMESYINYDDVAVQGFMGDLVGTVTISGTSYYKFDCTIANTADISLDSFDENNMYYCPECFHQGYVHIPTSVDLYNLNSIEAMMCPPIIIDGETVQLSSECYDIQITRSLPYSLRPTGTRCYINNERVATVNDIPEGIVTATNNRLNQESLYISGSNDNGYDVNTWWDVSIDESEISMKHEFNSDEAAITLVGGQAHISTGFPGVNYRRLDVDTSGIYEYSEHEEYDEGGSVFIPTTRERLVNESMLNSTITRALAEANEIEEIPYSYLRVKADKGGLIPGKSYKITDYTAVTKQPNTRSVHHDFDIIVQAIDTHTLSHDASVCAKKDDVYFKNSDLSSWKLKYDTIPDESKYPWVPTDTYQTWFCSYGTLHKTISGIYPPYLTKTINGSVKYLYPLVADSYLEPLYHMVYPEGVSSLDDILLVTDRPSTQEDDYLTLLIINKNTGVVYREFQQTDWWSESNVGFGDTYLIFDVYNYGETRVIDGKTYYVWTAYDDVTSTLMSYIGGRMELYTGSGNDLYCVMSQPLSHELESYECWTDEYDNEDCSIEVIGYMDGLWSSESDTLYTHAYRSIEDFESELTNLDSRIAIDGKIEMPSKGVIYELHDDKGNTASFDFKSIQVNVNGSFCYLLGTSKTDYSLSTSCNNTIKSDNIPLLSLQALSTNNTITCVKYTESWISTKDLKNNSIYLENKAQLTDCPYTNCAITLVNGYFNYGSADVTLTWNYGFMDSTITISKGMLRYISPTYTINNLSIFLTGNISNYLSLTTYPKDNTYPYITVVTNKLIGYKREDVDLVFHTFDTNVLTLNSGWYHKQTKATTSLMLKIAESANVGNTYQCEFTTHTSGTALAVPSWLQWENGEVPELLNNTTYLLSIIGDKAKCKPFYTDSDYFKITYTTSNSQKLDALKNITTGSALTNDYNGIGTVTYNKPVTSISSISSNSTLTSLVLPDSVTNISYWAFSSCSNLTDITIGSNISSADFYSQTLRNIYAPSIEAWIGINHKNKYTDNLAITCGNNPLTGSLTIPEGVPYIGTYALRGKDFTDITIPSTVTNVGSDPFPGFTGDLYINSQDILSKSNFSSHYGWGTPTQIILGGTIHTIPTSFCTYRYSNLSRIVLPKTLKELQTSCLSYNSPLRIPKLQYSTINVDRYAFGSSLDATWIVEDPNDMFNFKFINVTNDYAQQTFYRNLTLYDAGMMPVTAFENSKNAIFDYALASYKTVRDLTINPKTIGSYAFYNCNQLGSRNEVNLGNRLQHIGEYAFYGTALKTITLPRTVEYIGKEAFKGNSKLATVYCTAIVPPEMSAWAFYTTTTVYVPRNSVEAYKAAPGWSTYKNNIQPYDFIYTFTFNVEGVPYTAEKGMTWREWLNSSYNIDSELEIWNPWEEEMIGSSYEGYILSREECSEEDEYDCWTEYIYPDDEINPTYNYYKEWY